MQQPDKWKDIPVGLRTKFQSPNENVGIILQVTLDQGDEAQYQ